MIPRIARYDYCIHKSIEFILNENINKFPFDCDEIINKRKWARLKYESLANERNVSIDDIIEAFGSADGFSIYTGRNYTIAYNNTHPSKQRIYFTKLHEIGHIFLEHFIQFKETQINRSNLSDANYKILENEANCFARNVIAPAIIVKHLKLDTPTKISNYFGITYTAAKTRLDLLDSDLKYIDEISKKMLLSFFEENMYKKYCTQCSHGFTSNNSKYCPICGHDELILGDGNMKYDSIEIYGNSKTKICPTCENEDTDVIGEFCQICGTCIVNKCTNEYNCGKLLSGEARYCNDCGTESTFYRNEFLRPWHIIHSQEKDSNLFEDIDNLPFFNN